MITFPYLQYIYPEQNNNNLKITLLWENLSSQVLKIEIPDIDDDSSVSISLYKKEYTGEYKNPYKLIPAIESKNKWQSYIRINNSRSHSKEFKLSSRLYKVIQYQPDKCCLKISENKTKVCDIGEFNKIPEPISKYIFQEKSHLFYFNFTEDAGLPTYFNFFNQYYDNIDYKIPFKMGENISTVCTEVQLHKLVAIIYDTILTRKQFHTYEWEQVSGTPVIWHTDRFQPVVIIDIDNVVEDRIFKFWVDKGTVLEQFDYLYMFSSPSDNLFANLTTNNKNEFGEDFIGSFPKPEINNFDIIPIKNGITDLNQFFNNKDGINYKNPHNNYLLTWDYDESVIPSSFIGNKIIGYDLIKDKNTVLSSINDDPKLNILFLQNPDLNFEYGFSLNIWDNYFHHVYKYIKTKKINDNIYYSILSGSLTSNVKFNNVSNYSYLILSRTGKEVFSNLVSNLTSESKSNGISNYNYLILSKTEKNIDDSSGYLNLYSSINKNIEIDNYIVEILTKQDL